MDDPTEYPFCNIVDREYSKRVMVDRKGDHSAFLNEAILKAPDTEQKHAIQSTLVSELDRLGRYREAEALLAVLTSEDSENAFLWSRFAEHYHYYDLNLPLALERIDRAISEAKCAKEFVYYCLGIRRASAFRC